MSCTMVTGCLRADEVCNGPQHVNTWHRCCDDKGLMRYERKESVMDIKITVNGKEVSLPLSKGLKADIVTLFRKTQPWPQKGDKCFYLEESGNVYEEPSSYLTSSTHNSSGCYEAGNCFPTKEAALKEHAVRSAIVRVRRYISDHAKVTAPEEGSRSYSIVYVSNVSLFVPYTDSNHVRYSPFNLYSYDITKAVCTNCHQDLKIIFGIK